MSLFSDTASGHLHTSLLLPMLCQAELILSLSCHCWSHFCHKQPLGLPLVPLPLPTQTNLALSRIEVSLQASSCRQLQKGRCGLCCSMCLETEMQGSVGIYQLQQRPPVLEALGWNLKKITSEIKTESNPNRDMRRHRDNTMCSQCLTINSKERFQNSSRKVRAVCVYIRMLIIWEQIKKIEAQNTWIWTAERTQKRCWAMCQIKHKYKTVIEQRKHKVNSA